MFRYVIIAALLAMVSAAPAPEAKPDIILPVATSYLTQNHDTATEAIWVLVDSDGEDDETGGVPLKENDLVAIFNQLPMDNLFRCLLMIQKRDGQDNYDINACDENHVLRFLAISTVLLRLVYSGLQTYNQARYNQFSKRLSRFIRHVVQYATDQWEIFLMAKKVTDPAMVIRLHCEYDAFFLRAIFALYSSQKMGAWQFLAVVPYNMVTIKTLWKIFYFLHICDKHSQNILNPMVQGAYENKIWDKDFRDQFAERLETLEDAEIYYLLNTFANMALSRTNDDMNFIHCATMDLLEVGFICKTTQDSCAKSARILLAHITSKHPHLLSDILKKVRDNMATIRDLALYLYEDIPLSIWMLTDDDMNIIAGLLMRYTINDVETKLARMILSRLNWDLLPYEKHCDTALLVVKIVDQEPGYLQWGWQTILRLKLHISDKHFKEWAQVPELEKFDVLSKGVRENNPLASFVAILMTSWGHLVPLICAKGLNEIINIQHHQKHEAALFALYQIVPLFINSQECIINCEKFQEILMNLISADRGYISYAKSFIMTQNTVLQQFGNMIETQIVNYASYDLISPRLLVRLWMNSLVSIPNWNKDNGVLYLLDTITRAAFFHKDSLEIVFQNLRELYQCGTPQDSGSIISIFKWVSSGSNSVNTLLSSSLASYPWLAFVFLEIEHQEREIRSGLWREILIQLAKQKGKINVDNAIKKAASVVKITPFSSGWLCLYRWAQQSLDTPVDHPLLPLLWQKFFNLFLARLTFTSSADKMCVGERFFDGIVNFTFLKRIKRRLQQTVDHYRVKCDEESDDAERKQFYSSCLNVFQAFLLWLEEPRLQEGNILLQNLPVQYMSNLLSLIIEQNSNVSWYEFVDYQRIKEDQQTCIKTWKVANFRERTNVNQPLPNPGYCMESANPIERILRRLVTYDNPRNPPAIITKPPMVQQIDFSSKEIMFKLLEPSFKILKQFAHNHVLKISELKALDCSYKELIPQLYRSILTKVKKTVPCRGKNQTVLCSGAAIIVLEMQEAIINERIEHQIQTNRTAYESLLDKSLQSSAVNLYVSSVTIQQCVRILQQQLKCNPDTAELGVELFYYIFSVLNEEIISYPPTKILFSSCLEKLGQSHICGVENQMARLLQSILKEPNYAVYLAPHFSPANIGTSNMLLTYSTIIKEMSKRYDISFALLSKFEIKNWLTMKNPKLFERSQMIECIVKALSNIGFDPPVEALTLHGIYRKHLITLFEHEFPEHYGEVLMHLLKASNGHPESNLICKSVWLDIINVLSQPVNVTLKGPLREQLRQYAQYQKQLNHQELLETADLLARHFTSERFQYGLYGLYPKCRHYIDIYVLLLGMVGHGLIISSLNTHQGLLGDKMCEKIWPYLREMFAPWMIPYSMQHLKDNMATWIQQLADDRSILLPWIPSDLVYAQKIINVFFECILFIINTLPAATNILSFLWQWYVTCFAHISVKDHILGAIHQSFSAFPWHNFWPTMVDLEFMLKVIDLYLPDCHSFLGHVFISVSWVNWMNNFQLAPTNIKVRIYHCFLNLLVKLSNEPNMRKNYLDKLKALIVQAEHFEWAILEPLVFQHVMDWFVMSSDSAIIFRNDPLDLDYRLLFFLKGVSGLNKSWVSLNPSLEQKRLIFVKSNIKMLSVYVSRHRNLLGSRQRELHTVIIEYLNNVETIVTTDDEMHNLLKELVCIVNISDISTLASNTFIQWIQNKPGNGMVIKNLLKCLGTNVTDCDCLADLCELTITCYFCNTVSQENFHEPSWSEIIELMRFENSKSAELEKVLRSKGAFLTLNVILLQRVTRKVDSEMLFLYCLDWMEDIKISETAESKIPLLWLTMLKLALEMCEDREASAATLLFKFADVLMQLSEDKGGGRWGRGLLNAIGLTRQEAVSLNFRFICRALAGYVMAQLPEMKGRPQLVRRTENASSRVGQPGGNADCPKILLSLDFGQSQGKIKEAAQLALNMIQDPANSLHNADMFLWSLLKQFYIKGYLKDVS
ncbi:hypothetical protein GWI33_002679 [Rhynchophorus ferrugineus]|uniref:Ectopic P granules protein 5 homolog n=1 Tax=Rhynchophorus ferrugineus TaxID=354439 RepID=A0A834IK78_RHYFE|nr:hypothetical protein GWI33_002679 [Rhynchophorus ferrugineus]